MNDKGDSHNTFHTTRWSMVRGAAVRSGSDESKRALAELCETYWPPLYAYLRRSGLSPVDSEDTVQGFFAYLIQRDDLVGLSPNHGRFRAFLLVSLKHYLSNQRNFARTIKRGGGWPIASLDGPNAESYVAAELAHTQTAERAYERQWALTLLDRVKDQLIEDQPESRRQLYRTLMAYLSFDPNLPSYADVAEQFGLTEGAIKMTVSRMRKQYRDTLRSEIAQTVASPQEVEEEIQHLISVLHC